MKKLKKSVEQWLLFVGKEKLQTFQDYFAKTYGVSMVFLDMNGYPLTVGSQNSLFCFTIEKEYTACCQANLQSDRETLLEGKPFVHVCPFGIACLYVPVFFNNCAIAFAAVGGLAYKNNPIPATLKERFHITCYSAKKIQEIMTLLDSMLRLLDMDIRLNNGKILKPKRPLPMRMRDDHISQREYDIIRLICNGYSNKEIARRLFISSATVKTHISNILAKLNLKGRMQIVARYFNENEMMNMIDEAGKEKNLLS